MNKMGVPIPPDRSQHGFSLLETLVALAILSVASLALFQGTATLLRVSDQAITIGEDTLDHVITTQSMHNLAAGIVPIRYGAGQFKATPTQFSSMSINGLLNHNDDYETFTLALINDAHDRRKLVYRSNNVQISILHQLDKTVRFSYLGVDQTWYDIWPPNSPPAPPLIKEIALVTMPLVPQAIRLAHTGSTTQAKAQNRAKTSDLYIDWIAPIPYNIP